MRGSGLELTYTKPDPHRVWPGCGCSQLGEWGLRFWMALEVGFLPSSGGPAPWRPDEPWVAVENAEPMPPDAAAPPARAAPLALGLRPIR